MEMHFAPAPEDVIRKAVSTLLGGLRIWTDGSEEGRTIIVRPFLVEMAKYPADCAIQALMSDKAQKLGKDIQAKDVGRIAAELMGVRGQIRYALQYAIKNPDEMKWTNMSDDERIENRQRVRDFIEKDKIKNMPVEKNTNEKHAMARDILNSAK